MIGTDFLGAFNFVEDFAVQIVVFKPYNYVNVCRDGACPVSNRKYRVSEVLGEDALRNQAIETGFCIRKSKLSITNFAKHLLFLHECGLARVRLTKNKTAFQKI